MLNYFYLNFAPCSKISNSFQVSVSVIKTNHSIWKLWKNTNAISQKCHVIPRSQLTIQTHRGLLSYSGININLGIRFSQSNSKKYNISRFYFNDLLNATGRSWWANWRSSPDQMWLLMFTPAPLLYEVVLSDDVKLHT